MNRIHHLYLWLFFNNNYSGMRFILFYYYTKSNGKQMFEFIRIRGPHVYKKPWTLSTHRYAYYIMELNREAIP